MDINTVPVALPTIKNSELNHHNETEDIKQRAWVKYTGYTKMHCIISPTSMYPWGTQNTSHRHKYRSWQISQNMPNQGHLSRNLTLKNFKQVKSQSGSSSAHDCTNFLHCCWDNSKEQAMQHSLEQHYSATVTKWLSMTSTAYSHWQVESN